MKQKLTLLLAKHIPLKKEEIFSLIEIPPSPELGDYSFPCFTLSKLLKKSPNEIALEFSKKIISPDFETSRFVFAQSPHFSSRVSKSNLDGAQEPQTRPGIYSGVLDKIEAKGPYLNFFINAKSLAKETLNSILKQKDKYGSQKINEKAVIEFPSPNTNKPLHLGHVRNIVIGQSISNILKFTGNIVKIVNLNNDKGVHICKSMVAYEKFGKDDCPAKSNKKSDQFVGDYYVLFAKEAKLNPSLDLEAQECLQKWEGGDKKVRRLWKKMNAWVLTGFKKTYKKFNLKFDKEYFESEIYNEGKNIILNALKKNIIKKKEDGAIYADLSKQGLGEKILLRADGTSIYVTQDLYLAVLRQREFKFDKSLYITATEQNHHFKTLFALLSLLGYKWASKLHHLNYGMVNLESGRMKSREGNVVDADEIINGMKILALEEINKRYKNISQKEKEERADKITMSAIRYYFLKIERLKDMVFKPEESINFEGNTGPYLLYSYARARSILRKAKYSAKKSYMISMVSKPEKALLSQLSIFPEIVIQAYKNLAPNIIANYAFQLSQIFNEFYHAEKVIGSENEQFKLALVDSFSQTLKNSLRLLGIPVLERM